VVNNARGLLFCRGFIILHTRDPDDIVKQRGGMMRTCFMTVTVIFFILLGLLALFSSPGLLILAAISVGIAIPVVLFIFLCRFLKSFSLLPLLFILALCALAVFGVYISQ